MIIYLLRHGQTTGDIENRYGGDYDDHLTDIGKQQSAQLADKLSDKRIEQLYASPRIRAQETADIIAEKLGLVVRALDEFRERNSYGILTGMTKDEALQRYSEQIELLKDVHNAIEGAEEYAPFQKRIVAALETVSKESAEKVAVVTHGGPIRLIFRDILKLGEVDVEDCAYAVLEVSNGEYKLLEKNRINIREQK